MNKEEKIQEFQKIIDQAKHIVFLQVLVFLH